METYVTKKCIKSHAIDLGSAVKALSIHRSGANIPG